MNKLQRMMKNGIGKKNVSLITYNSWQGGINLKKKSKDELEEYLMYYYNVYHNFTKSHSHAKDKSHLAEWKVVNLFGHEKVIGYVTKDEVVFEGKHYSPMEK